MNMYTYYFLYINIYAYVIGEGLITPLHSGTWPSHFSVERRMDELLHIARQTLCQGETRKSRAHLSSVYAAIEIPICGWKRTYVETMPKYVGHQGYSKSGLPTEVFISPCLMVQSPFLQIYPYHLLVQSPSLLVDILLIYSWVVHLRVISYPEIKHCWIYH